MYSNHIQKFVVISLNDQGIKYFDFLKNTLIPIYTKLNKDLALEIVKSKINQMYSESVRQIFDSMNADIQDFSLNLLSQPYFDRFIDGIIIKETKSIEYRITNAYKEFALAIFYILYNHGMFKVDSEILLEEPGLEHLVLRVCYS